MSTDVFLIFSLLSNVSTMQHCAWVQHWHLKIIFAVGNYYVIETNFQVHGISSHLCHVNVLFLIVLHILFFFRPTNLSNSPLQEGAEIKLNCLLRFIYLTTDTKVCTILLFAFRGLPLHAMNIFNDMSFDFEVPENALLSLGKQYKVPFCVCSGKGTLVKVQYCQLQWVQTTLI